MMRNITAFIAFSALAGLTLLAGGLRPVVAGELKTGEPAPPFELFGVDYRYHSLEMYRERPAVVVVFLSNECPVSVAAEDRLIELAKRYGEKGVAFLAINPVPADKVADEGFPEMRRRAQEKEFPFPYLCDETQKTARAYGVLVTPEVFLLDRERRLVYKGAIGHRVREPVYLAEALDALLAGWEIERPEVHILGCLVDYRDEAEEKARFNR